MRVLGLSAFLSHCLVCRFAGWGWGFCKLEKGLYSGRLDCKLSNTVYSSCSLHWQFDTKIKSSLGFAADVKFNSSNMQQFIILIAWLPDKFLCYAVSCILSYLFAMPDSWLWKLLCWAVSCQPHSHLGQLTLKAPLIDSWLWKLFDKAVSCHWKLHWLTVDFESSLIEPYPVINTWPCLTVDFESSC